MRKLLLLSLLGLAVVSCDQMTNTTTTPTKPAATADDQSESAVDKQISEKIRQALVSDKSLSTVAKNVTVSTVNGVVTLRGSVNSDMEKMKIDREAKQATGVKNVINNIEVVQAK